MLRLTLYLLALISTACAQAEVGHGAFAVEKAADGIYVHHGEHLDIDTGYQGDILQHQFCGGQQRRGSD